LEAYAKTHKKYARKSRFGNWTTKIGPIENKLKDKIYRGQGKACSRMENHANGTGKSCKWKIISCAICMIFHSWACFAMAFIIFVF
jgi:hypothetical protein